MSVAPLLKLSIQKVCECIKCNYWRRENPFKKLPSHYVHSLFEEIIESSYNNGTFNVIFLIDLIQSSKLTCLRIQNNPLTHDVLDCIFAFIILTKGACEKLEKIELVDCVCATPNCDINVHTQSELEKLILRSNNLKYIKSCVYFDLYVIENLHNLETVILNFEVPEQIIRCISALGIKLAPNNSLKHFEVSAKEVSNSGFVISKAALQNFKNLTYINCCLTLAFCDLHLKDFKGKKIPTTRYKLEHCVFGKKYFNESTYVSAEALSIASVMCPDIKKLTLLSNDVYELVHLDKFPKLKELIIDFDGIENFSVVQLSNSLKNLTSISVTNVYDFDLSIIANSCPYLNFLRLENIQGSNSQNFAKTAFHSLLHIELIVVHKNVIEDCLYMMLVRGIQLKTLILVNIPIFNVNMFRRVLTVNQFKFLNKLHLENTDVGHIGMKEFRYNFTHVGSFFCV